MGIAHHIGSAVCKRVWIVTSEWLFTSICKQQVLDWDNMEVCAWLLQQKNLGIFLFKHGSHVCLFA